MRSGDAAGAASPPPARARPVVGVVGLAGGVVGSRRPGAGGVASAATSDGESGPFHSPTSSISPLHGSSQLPTYVPMNGARLVAGVRDGERSRRAGAELTPVEVEAHPRPVEGAGDRVPAPIPDGRRRGDGGDAYSKTIGDVEGQAAARARVEPIGTREALRPALGDDVPEGSGGPASPDPCADRERGRLEFREVRQRDAVIAVEEQRPPRDSGDARRIGRIGAREPAERAVCQRRGRRGRPGRQTRRSSRLRWERRRARPRG